MWLKCFLPFFLEHLNFTYWQQCPLTATLPSVSPCITQPSWTVKSACSLLVCRIFCHLSTTLYGLNLDFCASNFVDHFYWDTTPLLQISCSDTKLIEMMGFISAVVTLVITLVMVIISYTCIALTILRIPSGSHRRKAFSTCSSHMIVISLSYGSCIFMYVKPSVKQRISFSKGISVLNTSVAPLLNPFIYTLRNQQVKKAFMNMIHRVVSFSKKWIWFALYIKKISKRASINNSISNVVLIHISSTFPLISTILIFI